MLWGIRTHTGPASTFCYITDISTKTKEDKKAVRLDVQFKYGQDELLIDCSITHSLAKSHRRAEAKRTWERLLSNIEAVQDKGAAAIEGST